LQTLYWITLLLGALATALTYGIRLTRLGQGLIAIREDEEAARAIGVPVTRYKVLAYGLAALIPGAVGGVMALRTSYFEPQQTFDPIISFTIVTMAIIGGSDDARGPILGAVFLTILSELLWAKAPQVSVLLGILLVTFVVVLPNGIHGLLRRKPCTHDLDPANPQGRMPLRGRTRLHDIDLTVQRARSSASWGRMARARPRCSRSYRAICARARARFACAAPRRRAFTRRNLPTWHRPHVPDRAAVRRLDGARQCGDRGAVRRRAPRRARRA
jgi:hypothetical protein